MDEISRAQAMPHSQDRNDDRDGAGEEEQADDEDGNANNEGNAGEGGGANGEAEERDGADDVRGSRPLVDSRKGQRCPTCNPSPQCR